MSIKHACRGSYRLWGCLLVMGAVVTGILPIGTAQEETIETSTELTESLTDDELSELIQPFNSFEVDKIHQLEALEISFNELLLKEEKTAVLIRKDVQNLMGKASSSQEIDDKLVDTYQGQADHHAVDIHFIFNNEEKLTMIQRDDHHKGIYQPLDLNENRVKSWKADSELSLTDLMAQLGPPVTTWYYLVRDEEVFLWQSLVEAGDSSLIVTADSVGKLKFTYSVK